MVILTYDDTYLGYRILLFSLMALMSKLILNMIDNNLPSFKRLFNFYWKFIDIGKMKALFI